MKLTKLEKQMEEILYSDNGIPETWAGSEESIPKDKRIGKLLSLLETREREARAEGYEEGFKDGKVVITGQTGGTTYTSDGRAR